MVKLTLTVRRKSKIATLTKARKHHQCAVCQGHIIPGNQYYAITTGGAGLGSIKFPERVHPECFDEYFNPKIELNGE